MSPRIKTKKRDEGDEESLEVNDKIDPFGENPGWDPSWVKAFKINFLGKVRKRSGNFYFVTKFLQIVNLVVFGIFNIVFWGVALSHYYAE